METVMIRFFSRITELLGSFTVVFLFISGAIISLWLILYHMKNRRQREISKGNKITTAYSSKASKTDAKNIRSPFGSLCLALAGTLGVGNISGVASAIAVGGAGAVFWMWISALFCSALKYAEVVLAVRYRKRTADGGYTGGAHLYIKDGLGAGGLASVFCIFCVFSSFTIGNVTQVNAAAQGLRFAIGMDEGICGFICLALILIFCRSGSSIYAFTLRLIPFLCLGYIGLSLAVIFTNIGQVGVAFLNIISSAFTPQAGAGGIVGVLCGRAVRIGITRGVLSNEAGCGTAPIAHASAEARSPSAQGILGIIEVLFDTLFLCTLTAFVILISDIPLGNGMSTVSAISAFSTALGEWVRLPLAVSMLLFAIASAVGWNYYGRVSLAHLGAGRTSLAVYCFSYAVCAFFGAGVFEGIIWTLSDISIYMMSLINTFAVLVLTVFSTKNKNGIDIQGIG